MKNIGKIEDYKPKYQDIELLVYYNWLEMDIIGKLKWTDVKKKYLREAFGGDKKKLISYYLPFSFISPFGKAFRIYIILS